MADIKTSIEDVKKRTQNLPATVPPATLPGFGDMAAFELLQKEAELLCAANLLPDAYKGKKADAAIALEMAIRMKASPLMICQNLDAIKGRPAFRSKFLISTFNQCGRFSALRYEFTAAKEGADDWGCRAWAVELATNERLNGPLITVALAKRAGWWSKKDRFGNESSYWQVAPELMLRYRAAAWFINTYAPELSMGLPTREELIDDGDRWKDDVITVDVLPPKPLPVEKQEDAPKPEQTPPSKKGADPKGAPSGGAGPQSLKGSEEKPEPQPASPAAATKQQPKADKEEKTVPPQRRLLAALSEQCDGDAVEMQRLFNTVVGDDKHLLDHISGYTDFVAERYLQLLEDHLAKIEGGAK